MGTFLQSHTSHANNRTIKTRPRYDLGYTRHVRRAYARAEKQQISGKRHASNPQHHSKAKPGDVGNRTFYGNYCTASRKHAESMRVAGEGFYSPEGFPEPYRYL